MVRRTARLYLPPMPLVVAIALGGAAGTLARWWIGGLAQGASATFPTGTLVINIAGSFALGFLARYLLETSAPPELRLALTVGLCGGFTTFSTFSFETIALLESGNLLRAATYVTASVVLSLFATFGGLVLARAMLRAS